MYGLHVASAHDCVLLWGVIWLSQPETPSITSQTGKSSSNGAELRTNLRSCLMSLHCEQESEAAAAGPGLRGVSDGNDGHFPGDKSCHGC